MSRRSLSHPIIIGLTLGIGVGLSVAAALVAGRWEAANQQVRFQRQIENLTTALQRSLNRYTDVLAFFGDHYQVADGQVNRPQFETFAARSLQLYPGIQALEWAPLVMQGDRTAFEQRLQAEGYPSFEITELGPDNRLVRAKDRPYYIPVQYIAPVDSNEVAFGFDLNSDPTRTAAIEQARDHGQIVATRPIRLVQEAQDQYGFLVFLPHYRAERVPATTHARRDQFEGFLLGVFRVSDVVEESLQDLRTDIDFVLYDLDDEPQFLGHYEAAAQAVTTVPPTQAAVTEPQLPLREVASTPLCPAAEACNRYLTVGDRQWQVTFAPASSYALPTSYGPPLLLALGLLLTGGLVYFLHSINRELTQAQELSKLKQRFFSMASHELRTPLSTILLSAESLQLHQDDWSVAQCRATLQRIELTARRMGQQIADLLTLSRAEVGQMEFHPALVDVGPLCQQMVEEIEGGLAGRITLTTEGLPAKAFWDRQLVRSLLSNLLGNALKYSPDLSPVSLDVRCDGERAVIVVRDRGLGIPPGDRQLVRQAFRRGSNVGTVPGTGLGLAVVDTCVALHRGTWTIDSTEGQGTTVTVTLPLE